MSLFKKKKGFDLYNHEDVMHPERAWEEYCGFLALPMKQYVHIQNRLMEEQLRLWCPSGIGRHILQGKDPRTIAEFIHDVPLTTYEDYADILLARREDMLPAPVVTWVETTWEGGKRPVKAAPYTQGMLDAFKRNGKAVFMLASATDWGKYQIGTSVLSNMAPLPYLTGVMGVILDQEFGFRFMPPHKTSTTMSFSERTKLGFKMALNGGVDYFICLGSISYFMSRKLIESVNGGSGSRGSNPAGSGGGLSLGAMARILKARRKASSEGRGLLPKDLFDLRGFVVAGTDNACYKDDLERLWGVRPMELFAGTEATLVGVETWNRRDLYFFPDACFYEFLPYDHVRSTDRHLPTVTIDKVQPGEKYELVITSLRGGAFARYRTGDVYRCTGFGDLADHSVLPRFSYVDRAPGIIDIAGFTRITENSIDEVVALSHLPIRDWCAAKEFHPQTGHPFPHLYVEMEPDALESTALSESVIRRHLGIYFNFLDNDYESLKKILDMEPLQVTFLQHGSFDAFAQDSGRRIHRVNPPAGDVGQLVRAMQGRKPLRFWEEVR